MVFALAKLILMRDRIDLRIELVDIGADSGRLRFDPRINLRYDAGVQRENR